MTDRMTDERLAEIARFGENGEPGQWETDTAIAELVAEVRRARGRDDGAAMLQALAPKPWATRTGPEGEVLILEDADQRVLGVAAADQPDDVEALLDLARRANTLPRDGYTGDARALDLVYRSGRGQYVDGERLRELCEVIASVDPMGPPANLAVRLRELLDASRIPALEADLDRTRHDLKRARIAGIEAVARVQGDVAALERALGYARPSRRSGEGG